MQPQPGQLIRAPFLSAPAEVKKFEPRCGHCRLEVVLEDGHHMFKPLTSPLSQVRSEISIQSQPRDSDGSN
jgi:hypothetical protein